MEDLGLGNNFNKFNRVLAENEHEVGNYWKRETSYTGTTTVKKDSHICLSMI